MLMLLLVLALCPALPAAVLAPVTLAFGSAVTVALALLAVGSHRVP